MRTSLTLSLIFHGLVLTAALVGFSAHTAPEQPRRVSVDVITPADLSAVKAGKADAQPEKAARKSPSADKQVEMTQTVNETKQAEKLSQKQAALPPPKPKALHPSKSDSPAKSDPLPQSEIKQNSEARAETVPPPVKRAKMAAPAPQAEPRAKREPSEQAATAKAREKPAPRRHEDQIAELIGEPKSRAEGKSDFDPKKIAALLNRDPTAGDRPQQDGPRRPWRRPSTLEEQATGFTPDEPERVAYGAPEGRNVNMTANEVDAFRAQISRCWTPPVGGLGGDAIIVKLRIGLNEDGSLSHPPQIANSFNSPFFRPAADSAVRAVMQCQPYTMPPEKFSEWRDMLLTFDPRSMYGG